MTPAPGRRSHLQTASFFLLIALWVAGAGTALFLAARYRATEGARAVPTVDWPTGSQIRPQPGRATLVMLAHPRCPCTRASLGELARLMAEVGERTTAHVLFVRPPGVSSDWEATDTWEAAQHIPGVQVHVDERGIEAARFGALTSGQVVAFGPNGRLLFSGGITSARGHAGDNEGHTRLRQALIDGTAGPALPGPVFGCPLHDPPTLTAGTR